MKNYEQMAQSVLARRDAYLAKKQRTKQMALRIGIPAACAVVLAVTGVFVLRTPGVAPLINAGSFISDTPVVSADSAVSSKEVSSKEDAKAAVSGGTTVDVSAAESNVSAVSQDASATASRITASLAPQSPAASSSPSLPDATASAEGTASVSEATYKPTEWVPDISWAAPDVSAVSAPASSDQPVSSAPLPDSPSAPEVALDPIHIPAADLRDPDEQPHYSVQFRDYALFENWILHGSPSYSSVDNRQRNEAWYYMWTNADLTLKTGYYYRPAATLNNGSLALNYIEVVVYADEYAYCYSYCTESTHTNALTIIEYNNSSAYDKLSRAFSNPRFTKTSYQSNGIQYETFKDGNGYVAIFWQQNGFWYHADLKSTLVDLESVLPHLLMEKVPFRPDAK